MAVTDTHVSGGIEIGGSGEVEFIHGSDQADADIVLEWDLDNDGDFDEDVEDITGYLVEAETLTGRDWPSQLTGRAGPGQLKALLRNDDDRFSFFNVGSPLNQGANSLRTGRKIRVRTADAANPDPVLLARDRFLGSGALGADELGNTWTAETAGTFTRQSDSSGANLAVPGVIGNAATDSVHIAALDAGTDDVYAQIRWRHLDKDNVVGIVYRFEDDDNYGYVQARQTAGNGRLTVGELSGGVPSTTAFLDCEIRSDDYLGVFVSGSDVTLLHNGVAVLSGTAFSSTATEVGIYANWHMQRPPSIRELYVWDRLPTATDGILWTGDVTRVTPSVALGPDKVVMVEAEGRLAVAAAHDVTAPNSIGTATTVLGFDSPGSPTGVMVGGTLGRAGLLHPPGSIDEGDVTLGAVGLDAGKALEVMRQFEGAEAGFLHESHEGYIDFDARSARTGAAVVAEFSDAPGAQFGYQTVELLDWRGEIVNRVEAGIAPKVPRVGIFMAENTGVADVVIPMPDLANGTEVGDLLLVVIACSIGVSGVNWLTPVGWTSYRDAQDFVGRLRIYAKVVEQDDIDDDVTFLDTSSSGDFAAAILLVKDFYGDLQQGLVVSDIHGFGQPSSVARARAGDNDPPVVFPPWAPQPSTVVAFRGGMTGSSIDIDDNFDEFFAPNGFSDLQTASSTTTALQATFLNTNDGVIDPSGFVTDATLGAAFNNYDFVETVTIAIRGFAGDPPEVQGGQTVTVDDFESQERHRSVRTHANPARLFADIDDAEAYCEAVLITYADDRPICQVTFVATTNAAYRNQAIRRRVGHKIHLVANNDTGLGVDRDFYIEHIAHRLTDAGKLWHVTWQLSPA